MRLYFLRHADAMSGINDAMRPLSAAGVIQAKGVARYLAGAGVVLGGAYSSPLVRARTTAEIVLAELNAVVGLRLADELLEEIPHGEFEEWLLGLPEAEHLLLVGHAPVLAARVRRMAGLVHQVVELPKAGMACVETADRKRGELKFVVAPGDYP